MLLKLSFYTCWIYLFCLTPCYINTLAAKITVWQCKDKTNPRRLYWHVNNGAIRFKFYTQDPGKRLQGQISNLEVLQGNTLSTPSQNSKNPTCTEIGNPEKAINYQFDICAKGSPHLCVVNSTRGVYMSQLYDPGYKPGNSIETYSLAWNQAKSVLDITALVSAKGYMTTSNHFVVIDNYKGLAFYKMWNKQKGEKDAMVGEVNINFFPINHSTGLAPNTCSGMLFNPGTCYQDQQKRSQPSLYPEYQNLFKQKKPGEQKKAIVNKETFDYRNYTQKSTTDPYYFFETKYNYSGDEELHYGHGYWGSSKLPVDWYWIIPQIAKETMTGGPFKQDLRGAQLYVLSGHYIGGGIYYHPQYQKPLKAEGDKWAVDTTVEKSKIVGPFFVHIISEKRAKKAKHARINYEKAVSYANKTLAPIITAYWAEKKLKEYIPFSTQHRGRLFVTLNNIRKNPSYIKEAIAILSDEGRTTTNFSGYQYWAYHNDKNVAQFNLVSTA